MISRAVLNSDSFDGYRYLKKKFIAVLKLVIPGIIFPFILLHLNAMLHFKALELDSRLMFVKDYNTEIISITGLIIDFFRTLVKGSNLNGPLWTMRYELDRKSVV